METLHLKVEKKDSFAKAAQVIQSGGIVAFPTETVFGLGCKLDKEASQRLYALKKRPQEKSFTLHVSTLDILDQFVEKLPKAFFLLAKAFLPGPLTLILPLKKNSMLEAIFLQKTIGVRFPDHNDACEFIKVSGGAILATSANVSSETACVDEVQLHKNFDGKIEAILHGAPCRYKASSTVLALTPKISLLREGVISKEKIEEVLKPCFF